MKRTKLLCLRNIRLFKDGTLLLAPLDSLELANSVAVTFEMQKNDLKHNTVIHGRTDDATLCPVLQWACLVNRIWTYPSTSPDTPVCVVWRHNRLESIASHQVLAALCAACASIGRGQLGFEPYEMSTHSLQSGAATEMYLAGVPVYTTMLIDRWSSNAFLQYIHKQVKQFSKGVSKQMIKFFSF
jgi:hypothetical protein